MNLIDKDALVAKIEKLKHRIDERYSYSSGWKDALLMVEAKLDTLEVKEVDLEKEIDKIDDAIPGKREDIEYIAKHFFELGLKAQKGE